MGVLIKDGGVIGDPEGVKSSLYDEARTLAIWRSLLRFLDSEDSTD